MAANDKIDVKKMMVGDTPTNDFRSKSKFAINDINFNNTQRRELPSDNQNDVILVNNLRDPPVLKVTELQTLVSFDWVNKIRNMIRSGNAAIDASIVTARAGGIALQATGGRAIDAVVGSRISEKVNGKSIVSLIDDAIPSDSDSILGDPMKFIIGSFNGAMWVAQYEIPYFSDNGDTRFVDVDGTKGWSLGEKDKTDQIEKIIKMGFPVDVPNIPEWKRDSSNDMPEEITTKVPLINNNLSNLMRNFRFLMSLCQGPFWTMHGSGFIRPPNVYNVEYKGYFLYYYASARISIKNAGIMRHLTEEGMKVMASNFSNHKKAIDGMMFPDVYELTMTFKPLFPNNFNAYINYLKNGNNPDVLVGQVVDSDRKQQQ